MKVDIIDVFSLRSVPSASGMAVCGDVIYVIGDDSPFLHQLDRGLQQLSKWPMFAAEKVENGRIQKSLKPDLEAMELVSREDLVIFGSGSRSPERDVFIRVKLDEILSIDTYSVTEFYSRLKELQAFRGSELNIEAAAFHQREMLLFNRRSPIVFEFNYEEFINYLDRTGPTPHIDAYHIQLPEIEGVEAGFSGATISDLSGRLLVTASVEDTGNAYDDGRVLGSFIGWAPADKRERSDNYEFVRVQLADQAVKVESVAIEHEMSANEMTVLMITDSDGGISQVIRARLKW